MKPFAWIAVLLLAAPAIAQEPKPAPHLAGVSTPSTVQAKVNDIVWIEAKATGKVVWRIESRDRDKLVRIDPDKLRSDKLLGLIPREKGKYFLACVTVENGDIAEAETVLVVEDGSQPKPPEPTPPAPTDPLVAKLQAAFSADPAPKVIKDSAKGLLQALYGAMADHVKDPSVGTTEDLRRDMETTAKGLLPPGALVGVRKTIADELRQTLGTQPAPLTPELRSQAAACFSAIATALDAVK